MRVLNAYAGIGGNRHLWPLDWEVTAVELDARVGAEYERRYPMDVVLVGDAHAYVLEHAKGFDAVWTSPPCPTHSRLARAVSSRYGRDLRPDPRLWAEIEFLRELGRPFVVENVHVYYEPPVKPDLVTARHWYWLSEAPMLLTEVPGTNILRPSTTADQFALAYGLPPLARGAVPSARQAMRNAVVPIEGLEVALAAFSSSIARRAVAPGAGPATEGGATWHI